MMFLADLARLGDMAQALGVLLVTDNTFATPMLQRPLSFGADIVLHSTTKYLNGHSDMVGGALITSRDDLAERIGFLQNAAGRRAGTVRLLAGAARRQDAAAAHARALRQRDAARHLARRTRKDVARVYYPGLPDHPQHDLARRQMTAFGGIISIELGNVDRARRVVEATRIFCARGIAGRRREPGRSPGVDDPRVGSGGAARRKWA